ncbi:MAG TPA: hypothetical protein VF757_03780 [Sphingomicrobium sp.]
MPLSTGDLFSSPDHYLHSFQGDAAIFVPMDRAAYHRSIFLDGRISPRSNTPMQVPVSALAGQAPSPAPTGWIFHVAHCGSTLLARALDKPATNLVLREPQALRQLALNPDRRRLALVAAMLSKRYQADLPTVVKANVPVNFLLPELAGFDPQARAIMLHLGLRDYLIAIMRNERHRVWLRRVTEQLAAYLGNLDGASDADRAAMLWTAQMRGFAAAIARLPNARTLDGEYFFAEPARCLKLAAAHLCVPMNEGEIDAILAGPLFATYSKDPQVPFNNDMRLERRSELEKTLAPELEQAEHWVADHGGEGEALRVIAEAALQRESA